jgi:hypothetical protein
MLRIVGLLAVAVSIDVFMFDGRYSASAEHVAFAILRGFGVM